MHVNQAFHPTLTLLWLMLSIGIWGCPAAPAIIDGGQLEVGVQEMGTLEGGQTVHYSSFVTAQHHYAAFVTGSAGTLGLPHLHLTATGEPLDAPQNDELFGLLKPQAQVDFYIEDDGTLLWAILNLSEGLAVRSGLLSGLLGDLSVVNYRIRVDDLGRDDYGQSPQDPTPLATDGTALEGVVVSPSDIDFFSISGVAEQTYLLKLESSGKARLATGGIDRFDEFNFGSSGEVQFVVQSESGVPGETRFTAEQAEEILVGLVADSETLLFGLVTIPPERDTFPIQYAITVTEVEDGGPGPPIPFP